MKWYQAMWWTAFDGMRHNGTSAEETVEQLKDMKARGIEIRMDDGFYRTEGSDEEINIIVADAAEKLRVFDENYYNEPHSITKKQLEAALLVKQQTIR